MRYFMLVIVGLFLMTTISAFNFEENVVSSDFGFVEDSAITNASTINLADLGDVTGGCGDGEVISYDVPTSSWICANVSGITLGGANIWTGKNTFKEGDGDIISSNNAGAIIIQTSTSGAGAISFGNTADIGISSDGVIDGYDYDGTFVFKQTKSNPDGEVEFLWIEETGDWRLAIPGSGADYALGNPRSMMIGYGADNNASDITCSHHFDNIDCNTGVTGGDLGVQDDVEIGGQLWVSENITATNVNITGDLYVSNDTIYVGDAVIKSTDTNIIVDGGNVTAGNFVGDGSQLTNLPFGSINDSQFTNDSSQLNHNLTWLDAYVTARAGGGGGWQPNNVSEDNNYTTTGNVTASYFVGDGSLLTGVAGSGDVSKVGTPVDDQVGIWTGDGTIEGANTLTFNGSRFATTTTLKDDSTALDFDGFNDKVDVNINFNEPINVSFSMWIKPVNVVNTDDRLMSWRTGTNDFLVFRVNAGKIQVLSKGGGGALGSFITDDVVITAGVWQHLVVTVVNISAPTIYVNNDSKAVTTSSSGTRSLTSQPVGIGGDDSGQEFEGMIDEVAIWNDTLTANEVGDLYASGNGLYIDKDNNWATDGGSIGDNLELLWHFDENNGVNVVGYSDNNRNGTLDNMDANDWVDGHVVNSQQTTFRIFDMIDSSIVGDIGVFKLGNTNGEMSLFGNRIGIDNDNPVAKLDILCDNITQEGVSIKMASGQTANPFVVYNNTDYEIFRIDKDGHINASDGHFDNLTTTQGIMATGVVTAEHFLSTDDAVIEDNLRVDNNIRIDGEISVGKGAQPSYPLDLVDLTDGVSYELARFTGSRGYINFESDSAQERVLMGMQHASDPAAGRGVFYTSIVGETFGQFSFDGYGTLLWGNGTSDYDTEMKRTAPDELSFYDDFKFAGDSLSLFFGADNDIQMSWDATNFNINATTGSVVIQNNTGYGTIEYANAIDHSPTFSSTDFFDRLNTTNVLDVDNKVVRFNEEVAFTNRTDYSRPVVTEESINPCLSYDFPPEDLNVSECENITISTTEYPYEITEEGRDTGISIDINRLMIISLKEENQMLKDELCSKDPTYSWCGPQIG